ncbi:GAF and ANTAR domain-containing protein [Sphaerisporangium aureirubrum]|uniref:GAF and ANTAR domain-containing protein n=1 Tax=Sphaerisporangium aureirubrum TaxID=1544736 RepID=A0ABW1NN54_9ACTN
MDQRTVFVWGLINAKVREDDKSVSIDTICGACADALVAQGVGVALTSKLISYEPVCAAGATAQRLADLQATLGEGPSMDALNERRPVLVSDLDEAGAVSRWPIFAPAAVTAGVRSMHVFPMLLGAITVGVMEISRAAPGGLTQQETGDALVFADAALLVQTHQVAGLGAEPADVELGQVDRWAEVHQATGMVAVQMDTDLTTAFVRLRAHAYVAGRSLRDVSHDVLANILRFEP